MKYDLNGQKFGKLLVIEKTSNPNNKKKITFWRCICECGNESIVSTTDLKSGKTRQCWNCAHKQSGENRRKKLLGETFGYLHIDSVDYGVERPNGRKRTYCNCTCICGNKVRIQADNLKRGVLHSCGCGRKESAESKARNVIGMKFNRLTIIEELKEYTPRKVKCRCDCGNETILIKTQVMSGATKSCGCLFKDRIAEANTKDWSGYVNAYGVKLIKQDYKNEHGTWMWKCKCPICSDLFTALPADVASNKKVSCGCINRSANEEFIENILKENNVDYTTQYRIDDCRDVNTLPFDFAINIDSNMTFIEYDGRQHFEPIDFFGGEEGFLLRQKHDKIKNDYCYNNNISLVRIPYTYSTEQIRQTIMDII